MFDVFEETSFVEKFWSIILSDKIVLPPCRSVVSAQSWPQNKQGDQIEVIFEYWVVV
jgi:hypothetical protein